MTLLSIPDNFWVDIIEKGFDWIWLMGVWKHSTLPQDELAKHPGLIKVIEKALPHWDYSDVIGSPYSIVKYELNSFLGQPGDLLTLKHKLNDLGMKLMLDFVPNHFGTASNLVITNPEYFISTKNRTQDESLFKQIETEKGIRWIAYGKDPYFPPWTDTFQLNYFNENTQAYMINELKQIAQVCDGIRCDMAMLCLNEIIQQTWGFYLKEAGNLTTPSTEFWTSAIGKIKSNHPNFVFLAEVYWNLGRKLQQLGFDYTYDKDLYDLLEKGNTERIKSHLNESQSYIKKTLKFTENHDEGRAVAIFGREKSVAASIIIGTTPGISLYHQGQLEGERIKIPVQLRQKQFENPDPGIQETYQRILKYSRLIKSQDYQWSLLTSTDPNILAWQWYSPDSVDFCLVTVNYSSFHAQGNISLPNFTNNSHIKQFLFNDILNKENYIRKVEYLTKYGLFVDLSPFKSHLFYVNPL